MISRRRALSGAGAVAVGAAAGLSAGAMLWKQPPPAPRTFGLSIPGPTVAAVSAAADTGAHLGRTPQVMNTFVAWEWGLPFPTETVAAIRAHGAAAEITWEPWDPRLGPVQPRYALDSLDAHDAYVRNWALGAAAAGEDLHLRFAHEMNSDWYPWSVALNGGSTRSYVEAYRRLHNVFAEVGANNVRWVWCPNVIYRGRPDHIREAYPGDDFVDVVALDGYNRDGQSPESLFGDTITLLDTIAPGKPLWINETGCAPGPRKAEWIQTLFDYLKTTPVTCVVWFEIDRADIPDWKLLSTPESATAAVRSLSDW